MIAPGWQEKCLEDICTVKGGKRLPAGHSLNDEPTDHPYIKSRDIRGGKVSSAELQYLSDSTFDKIKRYTVKAGDVCITIVANIGDVGVVPRELDGANLTENAVKLTNLDDNVDPAFLGTLLSHPQYKAYLEQLAAGAAQAKLGIYKIRRVKVLLPPLSTQRKIAAILTAYDDLIETNKRRIALLEGMVEELYREWFIRMRFPGHQNTRFVKGVPDRWEMRKIERAFEFTGGGTPSKKVPSYWSEGTVNWFTPSDITGADGIFVSESEEKCSEEGLSRSSAKLFSAYSVMMTSRATIGAIGINTTPACTNQGFITCIPNESYPLAYLYQWLKHAKPYFEQLCGGATFPELTKGTFKKLEVLTPSREVIQEFTNLSGPIMSLIQSLLEQNKNLTKTRDLLLPRLISGTLSVEDLDIKFPPSMQEEAVEPELDHA